MAMSLRARLKRLLPDDTYNWLMLNFHILYRLPVVSFTDCPLFPLKATLMKKGWKI